MKKLVFLFIILNIISYSQEYYFPLDVGNYWQFKVTRFPIPPDTPAVTYDYLEVLSDTLISEQQILFKKVKSIISAPFYLDNFRYLRYDSIAHSINDYSTLLDSDRVFFDLDALPFDCWLYAQIEVCYFGLDTVNIFGSTKLTKPFYGGSIPAFEYDLAEDIGPIKIVYQLKYIISTLYDVYDLIYAKIDGIEYGQLVSILDENIKLPAKFLLSQNYPNPFNPTTQLSYSISHSDLVTLKVYDVLGTEIETLVNEEKPVGTYELNWNAANLPSGVYFYKLQAGSFVETKKMILLK